MLKNKGKVIQIIGPVIDVRFEHDALPSLYNAVLIQNSGALIVAEVMQHLGNDTVRCVSMTSTDGLARGAEAEDTGGPIKVPVGEPVL